MRTANVVLSGLLVLLAACSESPTQTPVQTTAAPAAPAVSDPVVVYSSRQEHLIKPVFDRFTAETGIEVRWQTGEEGPLIARLEAEGANTPADMLYTVDVG